jgi:hypothetical protein
MQRRELKSFRMDNLSLENLDGVYNPVKIGLFIIIFLEPIKKLFNLKQFQNFLVNNFRNSIQVVSRKKSDKKYLLVISG